jgi:hypothetical protein
VSYPKRSPFDEVQVRTKELPGGGEQYALAAAKVTRP